MASGSKSYPQARQRHDAYSRWGRGFHRAALKFRRLLRLRTRPQLPMPASLRRQGLRQNRHHQRPLTNPNPHQLPTVPENDRFGERPAHRSGLKGAGRKGEPPSPPSRTRRGYLIHCRVMGGVDSTIERSLPVLSEGSQFFTPECFSPHRDRVGHWRALPQVEACPYPHHLHSLTAEVDLPHSGSVQFCQPSCATAGNACTRIPPWRVAALAGPPRDAWHP